MQRVNGFLILRHANNGWVAISSRETHRVHETYAEAEAYARGLDPVRDRLQVTADDGEVSE